MSHRKALLLCAATSAILAWEMVPVGAQDGTSGPAAGGAMDEIIVSARKREESIQEIPVAVTAVTGDALKDAGVVEFTDLTEIAPNLRIFSTQSSPGGAAVTLRGQAQADILLTTDSSVGIYLDGVNLPRQLGLGANIFDVERIEVLRGPQGTLYGRNTTAGAINVISKKAQHNEWSGFVEATAGNFNRNDYSAAINIPIVDDTLSVRVAGQSTHRDGFAVSDFSQQEFGDDDELFLRGSLRFTPNENIEVLVVGDWQEIREGGGVEKLVTAGAPLSSAAIEAGVELGALNPLDLPAPIPGPTFFTGAAAGLAALEGFADGMLFNTDTDAPVYGNFDAAGIGGTITLDLDLLTIRSISGYRTFNSDRLLDLDGTPFTILHPRLIGDSRFYSQELQFFGDALDDRLDWFAGAFYSKEKGTDGSRTVAVAFINPANPSILDGDVENSSYAFFAQGTYALTDRLDLTVGGRWTEEQKDLTTRNGAGGFLPDGQPVICSVPVTARPDPAVCLGEFSDTFSGFSYLFSLDYEVNQDTLVYAKVSRGFRGGGQNLRGSSDPASFQSFDPEFAREVEVGLKTDIFGDMLRLNAAGFWTDYKDIQRSIIVPGVGANVVTVLTNAAEATILGFEIEAVSNPIEGLTLSANVGYTDAQYDAFTSLASDGMTLIDRSGEAFGGIPELTIGALARYETLVPNSSSVLGMQVNYYWQDEIVLDSEAVNLGLFADEQIQESYGLLNAQVDLSFDDYGLEFALFGQNLIDHAYYTDQTGFTGNLGHVIGLVGQPRVWGGRITKKFGDE